MPTKVALGSAATFEVLAGSGITIAGAVNSTAVTGDIGTFPTTTETGLGNLVLTGVNHAGDATTAQAKLDLVTAYNNAAGQAVTATIPTQLGSTTLGPGVYNSASGTFGITGALTLDAGGDQNAVFIFKMASTLITAASSSVVLANGANACNVFWQVGSSATLGTSSSLVGTILALTSITLNTSASMNGRLLARNGAVTMDTNTATVCEVVATPSIPQAALGDEASLLKANACLACLSKTELIALAVMISADKLGTYNLPGDTNKLLANSACFNCFADSQLLQGMVAVMVQNVEGLATVNQMRARIKCLACANPKQLKAAFAYLWSSLWSASALS